MNQNLKDLNFLKKNFEQLKAIYHRQQGEQATIQEQEASLQESVKEIHEQVDCLEQVRLLLMEAAKHAREQGRRQVELLVTQGLQFVFGDDIEFKVVVEEKRDRPEADSRRRNIKKIPSMQNIIHLIFLGNFHQLLQLSHQSRRKIICSIFRTSAPFMIICKKKKTHYDTSMCVTCDTGTGGVSHPTPDLRLPTSITYR